MQPIEVQENHSAPVSVSWRKQIIRVTEIIDHWSEMGRWWDDEPPFHYYLVKTERRDLLLAHDIEQKLWYAKPM